MKLRTPAALAVALGLVNAAAAADVAPAAPPAKEPAYRSGAPRYARLAFGPDGRAGVWVAADGDAV
jgi:hypothetical protein